MTHKITEGERHMAEVSSWNDAYTVAAALSKQSKVMSYTATNGDTGQTITYKGGKITHNSLED